MEENRKKMEAEASSFESSEMLATFLASTPLLSESWKLCSHANATAPRSFVTTPVGDVAYVAFSGVQPVSGLEEPYSSQRNLVALDNIAAAAGLFSEILLQEPAVKVHAGFLHLFLSIFNSTNFQAQVFEIMKQSKSVIFTGHSIGGAVACLSALWFLSYRESVGGSPLSVLCITFGCPLLSNESLCQALLQERWGGNFCHVVAKHDIVPRLLFAPDLSALTLQLHTLLRYWHLSMPATSTTSTTTTTTTSCPPYFRVDELFLFVLACVEESANATAESAEEVRLAGKDDSFWPFGNYVFCTDKGGVCVDNAMAAVKLLHLMFATASPTSCIEDHLKYGYYVGMMCWQLLENRGIDSNVDESSYEAGVTLALQSSEIPCHGPLIGPAKDCLRTAKRMGRTPNLNSATLAVTLSKINPFRAQIEWYKASCDASDDQLGYYDTFKLRGASKRDAKVNMNRLKLARFWDNLIRMLDANQLPHDFHKREKWVNAAHSYKLLVEPLDIAEYYRKGMHRAKGHYLKHGRQRRYEIFDKWWRNMNRKRIGEEEEESYYYCKRRSRFASLTQDSCFWARVEEAREWLENVRSESDARKLSLLWDNIHQFEQYTSRIVDTKEVSPDVLARNSSYSLWVKELGELKLQLLRQFPPHQFPGFSQGEVVP
ncbi:lipase-like PAD4 [Diospyros lotus]|uniref:lipase-like PAD4 n=1 Tax=Diospyros lotus TaxID=55363 RepID=UPI00225A9810|nr:lipase-like PAD4 [Diospyros lotus]